jgi:hypothetical protein
MLENKHLREEQDKAGSNPYEMYDFEYFRTKFNLTTEELTEAIREAKTNSPLQLEEYLMDKFGSPDAEDEYL